MDISPVPDPAPDSGGAASPAQARSIKERLMARVAGAEVSHRTIAADAGGRRPSLRGVPIEVPRERVGVLSCLLSTWRCIQYRLACVHCLSARSDRSMNARRSPMMPAACPADTPGDEDAAGSEADFAGAVDEGGDGDEATAREADAEPVVDRWPATAPRQAAAPTIADDRLAGWIERIAAHDEQALAALYDATLARVYGIVSCIVGKPALTEEVVEDTYFQVWRQAVRFDAARGRPMSWLLGMARSRAIDAVRREGRFRHESLDAGAAAEAPDDAPPADDLVEAARHHADLHRALMRLDAQPRQLVALAFFRGLSHEEIATQTCLPLGTVKSHIRRALITLRRLLGDGGIPAPST